MTPVKRGVDYSWARPGGAAIRDGGFAFAMRYVPYPGDGGKGATRDEIDELHAHGVDIGLVFESTAGRPREGHDAGRYDGWLAADSLSDLRAPDSVVVYFAVDYDASPADFAAIDAYLDGAEDALGAGRIGVYGSYDVIEHCHAVGSARWFWQTYAWSRGRVHPAAHVYQYLNGQVLNGGAVDYNTAADEFGQWKSQEGSMGMTPEQEARLERLEKLVAANGYGRDASGGIARTGAEALDAAAADGGSLFLGLADAQAALVLLTQAVRGLPQVDGSNLTAGDLADILRSAADLADRMGKA